MCSVLLLSLLGAAAADISSVDVFTHGEVPECTMEISHNASCARAAFGAAELRSALLDHPCGARADGWRVQLSVSAAAAAARGVAHEEGYALRVLPEARLIEVAGGGRSGAMYGALRLAELLRSAQYRAVDADAPGSCGAALASLPGAVLVAAPTLETRGLKMNVPLDARTPSYGDAGDSAQHNIATMWSLAFWTRYMDRMATNRYNLLSLWSLDPWPSLIEFDGEWQGMSLDDVMVSTIDWKAKNKQSTSDDTMVDASVLSHLKVIKKLSIAQKIAFWRQVMQLADNRGVKVMIVTWNVFVFPILNEQTSHGVNIKQSNEKTVAWVRYAINKTLSTYPLLFAIGTDPGERMSADSRRTSKEEWVWRTYGQGVSDALAADPSRKNFTLMIRNNEANLSKVLIDFAPLEGKVPMLLGYKYAHNAHMYGTTHPPYYKHDVLAKIRPYPQIKMLWNVRNDDIYNFRWTNVAYVREYFASMPKNITLGYHMGSDGYVWAKTWSDKPGQGNDTLEVDKHWLNFALWGRCGYQPCDDAHQLGESFWTEQVAARFGLSAAKAALLYGGWASASLIVPQVNRLVIGAWVNDFQWNVEGCFKRAPKDDPEGGSGFVDVVTFGSYSPVEDSNIATLKAYVSAVTASPPRPVVGVSPQQVAANLTSMAAAAEAAVKSLQYRPAAQDELNATLTDILAFASLGRYYSSKLCGATELALFKATSAAAHKASAVACLTEAVAHWQRYTALATSQYVYPQLLGRVQLLDLVGFLSDVKADLDRASASEPEAQAKRAKISKSDDLSISVDTSSTAPFDDMWRSCVGSGHAALWSRQDWREHLRIVASEIGFRHVRGHGILDNSVHKDSCCANSFCNSLQVHP